MWDYKVADIDLNEILKIDGEKISNKLKKRFILLQCEKNFYYNIFNFLMDF